MVDPEKHPRLIVIFNDQSRYEGKKSEEIIKNLLAQRFEKNQANKRRSYQQQIDQYRQDLKNFVANFYLQSMISDQTKFGQLTWENIKKSVCSSDAYIEEEWFKDLKEEEKKSISDHKQIEAQSRFFEERIDKLFPDKNFYFYRMFVGDEPETIERNMFE